MNDIDSPLVKTAQQGNSNAFARLYQKYVVPIYRFCYWQTNKSDDAEDLTQNIFVEAAKSLQTFKGNSSFKNWLYVIAKRQIAHWVKRKYQLPQTELLPEILADTEEWIDPDNDKKKRNLIQKLLHQLTPQEKKIIEWRYLRQQTIEDTAQKFQLSVSNVKVICHRTLKKLQKLGQNVSL